MDLKSTVIGKTVKSGHECIMEDSGFDSGDRVANFMVRAGRSEFLEQIFVFDENFSFRS